MYKLVVANLIDPLVSKVIVVAQQSWNLGYEISALNDLIEQEVQLVEIDYLTQGPAETIEVARGYLDPTGVVVTGNSDQYVDANISEFYTQLTDSEINGSIMTMCDSDPKWSYARLDASGFVVEVKEKMVISPYATVGIYGFQSAALMFEGFDLMRQANDTVNGEYYVAPSYNYLIGDGYKISHLHLGSIDSVMHGLGIPSDYERFINDPVSMKAAILASKMGV
jgi:dTDP-glucose pyrophosphorylase